jgi:nucleoside-diphosphate-sugar epimerase
LPALTYFSDRTLITGSEGFFGGTLRKSLRDAGAPQTFHASVTDEQQLALLAARWNVHTVVHLASRGTVTGSRQKAPAMLDVSVDGTVRLIDSFHPARFLLASSCAIYGDTGATPASPSWDAVHPVSIYGLSKAIAELVLREWAEKESQRAMILRFGNLVGAGGRGLIPYLVRHALQYPDGSEPAMMRGGGSLVRDYVPIDYAVRVIEAALEAEWRGPVEVFNVGTGLASTNRQIAEIVQRTLREKDVDLRIHFADEPDFGEARSAVLDCSATTRRFGISPPGRDGIAHAVRGAVLAAMETPRGAIGMAAVTQCAT